MIVSQYFWIIFLLLYKDVLPQIHEDIFQTRNGRIVGGYSVSIQSVPYQAFLLLKKGTENHQCGGSIISSRVILTAAHCLLGASKVYVRVGSTKSHTGGSTFFSTNFTRHPKFNKNTTDYDVGIVRLPRAIKLDNTDTKVIQLPESGMPLKTGTKLLVSGWGARLENGSTTTQLRAVELYVVSMKTCLESHDVVTSRMFCAGTVKGGKDSCQGDSGGPAVSTGNVQLGIISFGVGCGRQDKPGVYTNVATVRNWIKAASGV